MIVQMGQVIEGYELLEPVTTTGAGDAYKVRNIEKNRQETLKILPAELDEEPDNLNRFLREVKIHARLSHPNIAAFYKTFHVNGRMVMTSELVEGMTLATMIDRGEIPVVEGVSLMCQGLRALSYAHAHGVIHRNLSPSTMMVTGDGVLKLMTFDLARTFTDPRITMPGMQLGSIHYNSPEQAMGSVKVDERTDIYAMGVIFYEMLCGAKPFEGQGPIEVMRAKQAGRILPPSRRRGGIPPDLDDVVLKALLPDPEERFQTAKRFRQSVEQAVPHYSAGSLPALAHVPLPVQNPDSHVLPPASRASASQSERNDLRFRDNRAASQPADAPYADRGGWEATAPSAAGPRDILIYAGVIAAAAVAVTVVLLLLM